MGNRRVEWIQAVVIAVLVTVCYAQWRQLRGLQDLNVRQHDRMAELTNERDFLHGRLLTLEANPRIAKVLDDEIAAAVRSGRTCEPPADFARQADGSRDKAFKQ
jgi:hypothetical protein